jgi:hypothetical protein
MLDQQIGWAAVRFHGIALGDIRRRCGSVDCFVVGLLQTKSFYPADIGR